MTEATRFAGVRVLSGTSAALGDPSDVLVRDGVIERISPVAEAAPADDAVRIDGNGRVLMPGLIDAHWHSMMATPPMQLLLTADLGFLNLLAAKEAEATLLRGFTTVRDMGGPSFGLRRAIDMGMNLGPRIFPSGAMISQTSGHGDFRMPYEVPRTIGGPLSHSERIGATAIADSPDEVRLRAREQLMLGATQLKLMAGGGVASTYDPLDVSQYTEPEMRAAVEAAENWGTYVTVHAYTPRAIQMAIRAGVRSVEHGQLMDEATAALLASKGIWLCLQPFLEDEDAIPAAGANLVKRRQMTSGTDTAYALAIKHGVRIAFGTDTLFDAGLATKQGKQLAKLVRWFSPADVLRMATADNAELLALSGPRNPYPGRLGVVEEGAIADLLLVEGNPLDDIGLLADPAQNLAVIMKGGTLVKRPAA